LALHLAPLERDAQPFGQSQAEAIEECGLRPIGPEPNKASG